MPQQKFVLVGPREGQTVVLGNYQFVDGQCVVAGQVDDVLRAAQYLERYHSAFPESEVPFQQVVYQHIKEGRSHDEAHRLALSELSAAADGQGDGGPEAAGQGGDPAADGGQGRTEGGERDAGATDGRIEGPIGSTPVTEQPVADKPKPSLAEAVRLLDPEDDDAWTSNNLPALDALAELVGHPVNRGQVNEVAEGFTRAKARAKA